MLLEIAYPRSPNDIRSDASTTVTIKEAKDDANDDGGRYTLSALCGIFGPVEAKSGGGAGRNEAGFNAWERCGVEIYYKTFGRPEQEQFAASLFRDLTERAVKLEAFPRTVLSITLRTLCENRHGCGGITAAGLALASSLLYCGLPMLSVPITLEITLASSSSTAKEEEEEVYFPGDARFTRSDVIVSFLNETASPSSLVTRCTMSPRKLRRVLTLASKRANAMRESVLASFEKHARANRDLC